MTPYSPYPRIYLIFFLIIGTAFLAADQPGITTSHPGLSKVELSSLPKIFVDANIRDSFPCVYEVLQDLIKEKKGIFQEQVFHDLFFDPSTHILFSERNMPLEIGGQSDSAFFKNGIFYDTIYLNRSLFPKICREYLISVIIHESVHAFMTWFYIKSLNNKYLQSYFSNHPEWLSPQFKFDNQKQHVLMSENFVELMVQDLYNSYANPDQDQTQRLTIARALTWAGLDDTQKWGQLSNNNACAFHIVDIWARNVDADSTKDVEVPGCRKSPINDLQNYHFKLLCK